MADFFHVDKDAFAHEVGVEVPLMLPSAKQLPALSQDRLTFWRPRFSTEGFSAFGYRMLWIINWPPKGLTAGDQAAIEREIVFEEVREAEYPHRPSRFQSMFGFDRIEDATHYRSRSGHPEWRICTVEDNSFVIGDLNLYNSAKPSKDLARRYWSGERTTNDMREVLMQFPVRISGCIDDGKGTN